MRLKEAVGELESWRWNRLGVLIVRLVVGFVFIYSGFSKAVDPWGGYYKFNEYFLALGFDSLVSLSLFFAFALAAIEFLLGVFLVTGAYKRSTPILLTLFMAVMLPLSFYLAVSNVVSDCGCFGDAIHLSNWGTFFKNVLLTVAIIYLLFFNRKYNGLYSPAVHWLVLLGSFAFITAVAYNGYFIQPLHDYRPYKVGTRIASSVSAPDDDSRFVFIYEKDGKQQEFDIDNLPDEDDGWEFVQRLAAQRPDTSSVTQAQERIGVLDNGVDVSTQVIKGDKKQLLLLFPDIDKVNIAYTYVINEICEMAQNDRVEVIGLTSGSPLEMAQWNDISMATYKLYTADDSEIKMVARGNPALVYLENGVIKWKRTLASVDHNRLHDPSMTLATLSDDFNPGSRLGKLVLWYVLFMAVLLLLNRLPQILGLTRRRFDKGEKDSNFAEEELEEDDAPIVEDDDNETINT